MLTIILNYLNEYIWFIIRRCRQLSCRTPSCEQGYRPSLFYIKIGMEGTDYMDCSAEEDWEMATAVAHRYGLPLEMVDLQKEYWEQVAA